VLLCVSKGAQQQQQAIVYLVHLQCESVLPPVADVAMSHECQASVREQRHGRRDRLGGDDDDYDDYGPSGDSHASLSGHAMMVASRRDWKGMGLMAQRMTRGPQMPDCWLSLVRSARQRDDDVLEHARALEAFSWSGGAFPLAG
jgi:hypothetical protein